MAGIRNQDDQFNDEDISKLITGGSPYTAWQALLTSPPSSDYALVVAKETVAGTVRFSYANTGDPTDDDSPEVSSSGFTILIPAGTSIYVGSSNAGDTLNYSYRTIP